MFGSGNGIGAPKGGGVVVMSGQHVARADGTEESFDAPVVDPEALAAAIAAQEAPPADVIARVGGIATGEEAPIAPPAARAALPAVARPASVDAEYIANKDGSKRYEVVRYLTQGAQADISLVRDLTTNRLFIAKESKTTFSVTDSEANKNTQRMLREAELLSQTDNPYVVRIHDAFMRRGERRGTQKFVMILEYVQGQSIAQILGERDRTRRRQFRESELVKAGVQGGEGLAALAARGIIHRDVSPGNMMVYGGGVWAPDETGALEQQQGELQIKFLDLGVAHTSEWLVTTMSLGAAGTAAYMAPEQLHDTGEPGNITSETDICGLGLLLISMALGEMRTKFYDDHPPNLDLKRLQGRFSPPFIEALRLMTHRTDRAARRQGLEMLRRLAKGQTAAVPQTAATVPTAVAAEAAPPVELVPIPAGELAAAAALSVHYPEMPHILTAKELIELSKPGEPGYGITVSVAGLNLMTWGFVSMELVGRNVIPSWLGVLVMLGMPIIAGLKVHSMQTKPKRLVPIESSEEFNEVKPGAKIAMKNIRVADVSVRRETRQMSGDRGTVHHSYYEYHISIKGLFDEKEIMFKAVTTDTPPEIRPGQLISIGGFLRSDGIVWIDNYK